jgi:hypothetical protein
VKPGITIAAVLFLVLLAMPATAQDDVTTQHASSGPDGAWITGPASNPLSFLNGPAYRTFASSAPYPVRDFRPITLFNRALPAWISFEAENRLRVEGYRNGNFTSGKKDTYVLNRFRYQMDLRPASWLKVVSQVQDARPFFQEPPHGPPNEDTWDLKLAYLEAGDPEKQRISVRFGRQLINYNNTIIANSEWRDQGRSYDAFATNLHFGRVRTGIFTAYPVITRDSGVSRHEDGNMVSGVYGRIDDLIPKGEIEPFVLQRRQPSVSGGKQNEKAFGVRLKGKLVDRLDYSSEVIIERGSIGSSSIRAWGTSFGVTYRMDSLRWHPRVFGQYDFASGDAQPSDSIHRTFDTMYPTAHDRFGITDLFGWQNIAATRGGITVEPRRRWTISTQYLNFSLAVAADGIYNSSGGLILRDATGKSGTHIGEEVDVYTWYELNAHMNVGGGLGRMMGGSFISHLTSGPIYTYPYFAINFKDNGKTRGPE